MTETPKLSGVRVAGTGSFLPPGVFTNEVLSRTLDTSDEWIRTRTGIGERRWADPGAGSMSLAVPAAKQALQDANVAPEDVDLVICATMTADYVMPTNAALLQRELGLRSAGGFDLNSACSGFVAGLTTAASFVRSRASRCALLVAAEQMSTIVDEQDRATRVIFADGAGAVVLQGCPPEEADLLAELRGLRGDDEVLLIKGGGSRFPASHASVDGREHHIWMKGSETFKFAVKVFASMITDTCQKAGIDPAALKLIVPHQVNLRILEAACRRANVRLEDCVVNIERVGNTSAASVAIALDEAVRAGRVERGDLVLLAAFGGGLSWSSALLRW